MSLSEDLIADVDAILYQTWTIRDGITVPSTDSIALAGGGVRLEAVMFYADLADSTELVLNRDRRVAAKVFKTFLTCSARLIKARNGVVRSFDGDRVMGVFLGDAKRSNAAKCALNLKWAFDTVIKPKLLSRYEDLEKDAFRLNYAVGIDVSDILVVRGGVRNDNDLLWVGRAANVAAKLSGIRENASRTFITYDVYKKLNRESKFVGEKDMWTPFTSNIAGFDEVCYKSSYHWKP